ncbi:DUF6276 family protein [Halanaeroarchaeum sulfurireducens]|uniref:Small CPxCG-related zinc finger protein n=1 Tax=Halanaeroarchaeum sulfurireducens TaxID=1604004 RepID=A0A0F7P954_9EURY|nr:DUF6276 family protein [Halanaeroarchaeum sulfurireducens]AKH96725.1 hypothetical protein HLASF_0214 [Halanaeroarchaeum sulfurireducens]ALG81127.1 hypothetical protein HLASA_0214 [Halanaeroarchaeum sulfurireducens]
MRCPNCGAPTVVFTIPEAVLDAMPETRPGAALCTRCLTVTPVDEPPDETPDWTAVHETFPTDDEAAATVGALLALVDSLALYRSEIEEIARHAESLGVDVMLVLDRLAADDGVDPHFDIDRRRAQLEQLLE